MIGLWAYSNTRNSVLYYGVESHLEVQRGTLAATGPPPFQPSSMSMQLTATATLFVVVQGASYKPPLGGSPRPQP
ncbi:hypothetical protein V6N12_024210 [Hibiscus sabdariffa]|uniref:Uncharacterized protein n=1 Tax=Hibiscus sabdariffa TaxID=183260 RepID=A0ABR2FZW4_9ROSI